MGGPLCGRSPKAILFKRTRYESPGCVGSIEMIWAACSVTDLRVSCVAFVMLAALAVHAARGFEDVLRVEAAEGSCLENLVY